MRAEQQPTSADNGAAVVRPRPEPLKPSPPPPLLDAYYSSDGKTAIYKVTNLDKFHATGHIDAMQYVNGGQVAKVKMKASELVEVVEETGGADAPEHGKRVQVLTPIRRFVHVL